VIKSKRIRWAGHVARISEERWMYKFLVLKWGYLGVDGLIILGRISRRWDVNKWTGLGWPRIERGGGLL
jgi:hypothetical protein